MYSNLILKYFFLHPIISFYYSHIYYISLYHNLYHSLNILLLLFYLFCCLHSICKNTSEHAVPLFDSSILKKSFLYNFIFFYFILSFFQYSFLWLHLLIFK
ncbi:hypothetical protein PFLG_03088 [Plasmodium falciparum RAJ116]|uniref:Uncharacterized protein n=1 Tax=Plasmodium falciparum RAJ116 TaxID=580058 RepID=A0A0L0D0A4_PLAFA|nr:hypothetical protein PFLG_03088 [Plasmodium falciparum RAJ116]